MATVAFVGTCRNAKPSGATCAPRVKFDKLKEIVNECIKLVHKASLFSL